MKKRVFSKQASGSCLLGGDVGGTHARFVLGKLSKKGIKLIWSLEFETKKLKSLKEPLLQVIDQAKREGLKIKSICLAVAGAVVKNKSSSISMKFSIDGHKITRMTKISCTLINDFAAVGYGIPHLPNKSVKVIKSGTSSKLGTIAAVGAGTGLGKNIMKYNQHSGRFFPLDSEGGSADLPIHSKEIELLRFLESKEKVVQQDTVLSGQGIVRLYEFFLKGSKPNSYDILIRKSKNKAELIAQGTKKSVSCKKAMKQFSIFYARILKNTVFEFLPYGGIYIAGGIAAKNPYLFDKSFLKEFLRAPKELVSMLNQVPIKLITNYDVSLYGAILGASL
jgi:glucokinase